MGNPTAPTLNGQNPSRSETLRASPPMFSSPALDRFTRVHASVPLIIFVPIIVALEYWGLQHVSVPGAIALGAGGYAIWTLFEYWLHRIVFHWEPDDGPGARFHWMIHGVHHDHPNDPLRLVMPPAASIPLGLAVFGLLFLGLGEAYAPSVAAGFFAGYLVYDMMHYYLHHFRPHGRLGRMLRERHMRHHFQDETKGYGISAPYWDEVFDTSPTHRSSDRK